MPTNNPAGVKPVTLEIDGKPVTVDSGATVMDAATKLGIFVPHFCYHKNISSSARWLWKGQERLPGCTTS